MGVWPRNPTNYFKFKNCLFRATSTVKNSDKEKYMNSSYGKTFDSAGSWSSDNDTTRNTIIFCVDGSSSSHADNRKNIFLVLGGGPTFGINRIFGSPEEMQTQNFARACTIILIIGICLLMEKNSSNLKLTVKMLTFQLSFV